MRIREERREDFDRIDAVLDEAFGDEPVERLVRLIRASEHYVPGLAFVAVDERGRVVGHTMLSYAELEEGGRVLQLSPLGVEPDRQRQGFGSALVRHALAAADELEYPLVVLVGDPRYYNRFGFVPSGELGILPPASEPDAPWQAVRLGAYDASLRGRLRLPPAFDAFT